MKIVVKFIRNPQLSPFLKGAQQVRAKATIKYRFSTQNANVDVSMDYRRCRQQNSIKKYQQFLQIEGSLPYHGEIRFSLGNLYFQARQYQLAINQYTKAIKLSPQKLQYFIKLAESLAIEGERQQALQVLEMGLKNISSSGQLASMKTQIYIEMGQYIQAFRYLNQRNFNGQSTVLSQTHSSLKTQQTITELLAAYSLDVQCVDAAIRIKDYFLNNDKAAQGKQFFQTLLEEHDSFALNFTLGTFLFQTGESLQAVPYLRKAIIFNANHYHSNLYLGTILLHENKLEESKKLFQKTIQLDPKESIGFTTLGLIHFKLGLKSQAKEYFLRAMNINPMDSIASSSLGALQMSQGYLDAGMSNLKKSLELDPTNQIAKSHLETVQILLDSGEAESAVSSSEASKKK